MRPRPMKPIGGLSMARRPSLPAEVLVQKVDGPLPGERSGRLVVARRGVVVEAVLRARVAIHRVRYAVGFERRLVGGPAGVHALVAVRVLDEKRRLDARGVGGG